MAFRLKSPKSQLLMRKRKSLSLKTPEGLQVDPSHTKAVFRFPTPKDVRDTRYFMGRAHVPIFSAVIRLMNELLKKHTPFVWSKARFAGRGLTEAERNYGVTETEALAIV
ncbi:hypothetical protein LXG23DRAFT_39454 [Yarrowia lipolytica]|nr:hypothetical protein BKA91DRAFT_129984 [Yarrowia lipolytica]KAE8169650.1 hypothetical protein BKA90DRAFT_131390 [Yarrowia lipolytica]KAJ8051744.1 hypothetical protein LXG23DRAFT_39454 [Yarrowia lipolytica]RMI95590.1 hypothetical protein BD777DRAFT_137535 [Yarrowia lipolytica]